MRLARLRKAMAENNLDGVLITQPENRRYLSGFTGSAGVLIIPPERQAIATDFRYYRQVQGQCPGWELLQVGYDFEGRMLDVLRSLGLGGRSVGFEAGNVSVDQLHRWERALKGHLQLVNTTRLVEDMRMAKDESELNAIRQCGGCFFFGKIIIYSFRHSQCLKIKTGSSRRSAARSAGRSY